MQEGILKEEYKGTSGETIEYTGFSFNDGEFEQYLCSKVKPRFEDAEWTDMLIKESVELTGFSTENLVAVFENREMINEWRIGELVAECILEDKYKVRFYYNSSRDAKNLRSNLTGADLVGFCDIDNEVCFLFGEVKTSCDPNTPPHVLYGKSGMIRQLESLKDNKDKRHDLVKWIASKAIAFNGSFKEEYGNALKTYISSKCNKVHLVGVLVRDTQPTEKDIKGRAAALNKNIPKSMSLMLASIYTGLKMNSNNWEKVMNGGAKK